MAGITQDEATIYDRQIRLWGLDAQQRIQKANVLVAGIRALSNEVCKNLALAGVGSITLLDHRCVVEEDLGAQFLLREDSVGKNCAEETAPRIKILNPRVNVIVDQEDINAKSDAYFETFDIVCLIGAEYDLMNRIDCVRRKVGKPFYAADAFGWIGYIFCDLKEHSYVIEKRTWALGVKQTEDPDIVRSTETESYISLATSLSKNWSSTPPRILKKRVSPITFMIQILLEFQRRVKRSPYESELSRLIAQKADLLREIGVDDPSLLNDMYLGDIATLIHTEMASVSAIVGGFLSQEILKVLSAKDQPLQNWFYYDGRDGSGRVQQH
ncbi:SUMO-activating enzyme subunit 1-like protein [Phycomyces nitens]|nr:SUMO-activating enzyme subunit 1-like protein [Phycomyces nitens]